MEEVTVKTSLLLVFLIQDALIEFASVGTALKMVFQVCCQSQGAQLCPEHDQRLTQQKLPGN